jgi:hypothetical protein
MKHTSRKTGVERKILSKRNSKKGVERIWIKTGSVLLCTKGGKFSRAPFFGVKVKSSSSCRKILRHVKDPCGV